MTNEPTSPPPYLSPDKLLALGAYGEMVAAYRYLVLAERAVPEEDRRIFARLADEEQENKQRLQKLLAERYPDADFVLTAEDKELVVTGPRLLDAHREVAFAEALEMMLETERKVAEFYARHALDMQCQGHADAVAEPDLRALFKQLAEESAQHHQHLLELARQRGAAPG